MTANDCFAVTFYKTITDNYGRDCEISQGVIELFAPDEESATSQAKEQFCRSRRLRDWSFHADRYEIRKSDLVRKRG